VVVLQVRRCYWGPVPFPTYVVMEKRLAVRPVPVGLQSTSRSGNGGEMTGGSLSSDDCHRAIGRLKYVCILKEDDFAASGVLWLIVVFYRKAAG